MMINPITYKTTAFECSFGVDSEKNSLDVRTVSENEITDKGTTKPKSEAKVTFLSPPEDDEGNKDVKKRFSYPLGENTIEEITNGFEAMLKILNERAPLGKFERKSVYETEVAGGFKIAISVGPEQGPRYSIAHKNGGRFVMGTRDKAQDVIRNLERSLKV